MPVRRRCHRRWELKLSPRRPAGATRGCNECRARLPVPPSAARWAAAWRRWATAAGQNQGKEKRRDPKLAPDEDLYTEDRPWTEAVIGNRRRKDLQDGKESK